MKHILCLRQSTKYQCHGTGWAEIFVAVVVDARLQINPALGADARPSGKVA
jgi:hypothetical protein